MRRLRTLAFKQLALSLTWIGLASVSATGAEESLIDRSRRLYREYDEELEALARSCDQKKLPDEAAKTRAWALPVAPLTLTVAIPDDSFSKTIPNSANAQWVEAFRKLRQTEGKRLFDLALAAAAERDYALAYRLVHETLREDADHEAARRLLGYKVHQGQWLTPYELNKAQAGQVWHEQFGWLLLKNVKRYEAGERFSKGRWVSADEDARQHADIDRGWDVVTEHYQVRTNHSLEEGVKIAARLEEFYRVWRQLFVRFYTSDEQLARLFRTGLPANRTPPQHKVRYFRNRDEYIGALKREQPHIDITGGYYLPSSRTAYFFVGPEENDSNIYHEATHQLFAELKPVKQIGVKANFWIVEGIACFFESYRPDNALAIVGGADALRLENARARLVEGKYLSLDELCGLGMADLQRHDEIKMVYSESAGLTYFLLFADEGRYRSALVDYLSAVYGNRDDRLTLAELTDTSYSKLDEQFRKFIQQLP